MANQTLHTKHHSQNEQPIVRNPTLSYTRCQKVLNFLDNRTQLWCQFYDNGVVQGKVIIVFHIPENLITKI